MRNSLANQTDMLFAHVQLRATREPDIGASQPANKYVISGQEGTDGSGKELFPWGRSEGDPEKVIFSAEMQEKIAGGQGGLAK